MTWFVKMKCVELKLAENQELGKKGSGKGRLKCPVYDMDLFVDNLFCQDKIHLTRLSSTFVGRKEELGQVARRGRGTRSVFSIEYKAWRGKMRPDALWCVATIHFFGRHK